jgi:hypothetical protein
MKFKRLSDHRNTSVSVLIVKQLRKLFRLSKHPRWHNCDISTHHSVRLICVPDNSDEGGNEIPNEFTRNSSTQQFAGPEPNLGISGHNITPKIMGWLFNQYLTLQQSYQHSEANK